MSPLGASLVLAVPWTVMHLVLLLPGAMNEGVELWPTVVSIAANSVLLTWVFVGSRSILLAALVHTGLNGVVPLMSGIEAEASWAIRAVVAAAIAVAVVAFGGYRRRDRVAGPTSGA
jgi:membrane protease YdiL (CAAX protease family)